MDLIVISKEVFFEDETVWINRLFESGMSYFHLRKPTATDTELRTFLNKISPSYHRNISLHQHHHIAENLGISRLHFNGKLRKETSFDQLNNLSKKGYNLSTSSHSTGEIVTLSDAYTYSFLSPVFNSISKTGYQGFIDNNFAIPERKNGIKVYGLGGIYTSNIRKIKEMNFDGAAVLGALWNSPKNSVEVFKELKELCQN